MAFISLGRVSALTAVGLLFAGCGGSSQSQVTIPQNLSSIRTTNQHGKSWMKAGGSSGDLIYAPGGCDGTCVISYPALKLVGSLPTNADGACSDAQGNVFLPYASTVTEYAHGGTKPVATLSLPGGLGQGCAVDPKTGNLAVVFKGSGTDVAIFANEQGTPALYGTHIESNFCGYDDKGNLFVDGMSSNNYGLAELPKNSSKFTNYIVPPPAGMPGQLQWDGTYLTYESSDQTGAISRLSISGSSVTIVGMTKLRIQHRTAASWLYDGAAIVPYNVRATRANVISLFNYPKGGKATKTIRQYPPYKKRSTDFAGLTLSVHP